MTIGLQWRWMPPPVELAWQSPNLVAGLAVTNVPRHQVANLIGPAGMEGPAGPSGPQGEQGPAGEPGPAGPALKSQIIGVGGRWYLYADNRWVGFSVNYGAQTDNYNQNGGTGAEPNIVWNQIGPFILDGGCVKQLRIAGRCNSNEVTGIDVRLYHQTGPWTDKWDSAAETARTLLHSSDNLDFSTADMRTHILDIDQTVVGDGFLLLMIRPVGSPSVTRFLTSSVSIVWDAP